MKDWKGYQQKVAHLFRSQGCEVKIDETVQGSRGKHQIDVWISFNSYGYENLWIGECKLWKTSVPKEKVLALQSIIQDVGADKGLLFSESGFQSGAISCTQKTNVVLTCLEELKLSLNKDINFSIISKKISELVILKETLFNLSYKEEEEFKKDGDSSSASFRTISPPDQHKMLGTLSILEMGLQRAWNNQYPVLCGLVDENKIFAENIDDLLKHTEEIFHETKKYIEKHKNFKYEVFRDRNSI